jgi:hypothetical protein
LSEAPFSVLTANGVCRYVVPAARREPDAPDPLLLSGDGQREHRQREEHRRRTAKKGDELPPFPVEYGGFLLPGKRHQ